MQNSRHLVRKGFAHANRLNQVVQRGLASKGSGSSGAEGEYLHHDECADAAKVVSQVLAQDNRKGLDEQVQTLRQCSITPRILHLGEELSKDRRVQDAVLEHFHCKAPATKDMESYLAHAVNQLREDLEEQQDLNQSLIQFQDIMQEKMAKLKKQNREMKKKLARAKAKASRHHCEGVYSGAIIAATSVDLSDAFTAGAASSVPEPQMGLAIALPPAHPNAPVDQSDTFTPEPVPTVPEPPMGLAIALAPAHPNAVAAPLPSAKSHSQSGVSSRYTGSSRGAVERPPVPPVPSQPTTPAESDLLIVRGTCTATLDERHGFLASKATQIGICVSVGVAAIIIAIAHLRRRGVHFFLNDD